MDGHPIRLSDHAGFRLSDEIRLWPNYICFTPDRIGTKDYVNISHTIRRCGMSIVWVMLSRQSVLEPADQWPALSFHVSRSPVYIMDAEEYVDKRYWSVTVGGMLYKASSPSKGAHGETAWPLKRGRVWSSRRRMRTSVWFAACVECLAID